MKRIINGVTYNTNTSTAIAQAKWSDESERTTGTLYQTRGGAFFVHEEVVKNIYNERTREWGEKTDNDFLPLSQAGAHKWLMEGDVEVFHNPFDDPPEAAAEADPGATIYIRMPASLKRRVDEEAQLSELSGNVWAMRCIEKCIAPPDAIGHIWYIASTFAASKDEGEWTRETCIEALCEIADLVDSLAEKTIRGGVTEAAMQVVGDDYTQTIEEKYRPFAK